MEEDQRHRPPRAVNIIRPSSPLLKAFRRPYFLAQHNEPSTPSITTAGSMTSSSTWSSSSSSILSTEPQSYNKFNNGLIHNRPGSPFTTVRSPSPTGWSMIAKHMQYRPMSPLGTKYPQQQQNHYTPLSRIAALSQMSTDSTDDDDLDEDDIEEESNDSDDNITPEISSSDSEEEEEPEVVARMKQGCTILNGRGEFVTINDDNMSTMSSSNNSIHHGSAKLGRKIADLEIEINSLSTVNASLEEQTRQQAARIAALERQLTQRQVDTSLPPTPVSMTFSEQSDDENENMDVDVDEESDKEADQVFERIKGMLQVLIEQAQRAITAQSKTSGRVLPSAAPANIMDFERASTSVRRQPTQRQRSASRNSVVSCPPEIRRPQNNRRSWPTVTATNSRLLRMATQPLVQPGGRQRSQSMVRASSSP
ncbi:hypothetical protein BDA99DRAFT_540471 [Phascolomyces articulosus]|uniref:Uncharacterized protein n=1 Tax=Phascolomyces articulosus TaxID=60185 RepID=A0AAD5PCE4_9FUNG|nr:hypothetical protein BDA99DRAFT_540471 [Phascolomyces articulosus]